MTYEKPSSTQIGAIAENIVANELIVLSRGRFSPFSPLADDDGIDVLVYDKLTGRSLPLQVKSRTDTLNVSGGPGKSSTVHFEVRKAALRNERRAWLLAVLLTEEMNCVERAWLVPMTDIPSIAGDRRSKFVLRPSKNLASKDKFSSYQCPDMAEVVKRMAAILDR